MSQPAKAQEPSMEEILASIRRIIADDDTAKPAPPPAPAAPAPPPAAAAPPPRPAALPPRAPAPPPPSPSPRPAAAPEPAALNQDDIDAMMARPEAAPADVAASPDEVLELTEQMAVPVEEDPPSFQTIDGQSDVVFTDPPAQSEPPPPPRMVEEPRRQPPPPQASAHERTLMSANTSAAVDSAFNALAQTVLVQNARTLEDLVREMLRPLLKGWLDDNLPGMVERIVKAEIERVSRGRS